MHSQICIQCADAIFATLPKTRTMELKHTVSLPHSISDTTGMDTLARQFSGNADTGRSSYPNCGFNDKSTKNVDLDILNRIGYGSITKLFNVAANFKRAATFDKFQTNVSFLQVTLGVRWHASYKRKAVFLLDSMATGITRLHIK